MSAAAYVIVCMALTEVIDLSIGGSKRPDVNTLVRMYITLFITLLDLLTATHLHLRILFGINTSKNIYDSVGLAYYDTPTFENPLWNQHVDVITLDIQMHICTWMDLYMDRYEYIHKYISMFIPNTVM